MIDFPTWLSGTVTIVALFGLGLFVYPYLLKQPGGAGLIGAFTVALTFLFYVFDSQRAEPIVTSALLGLLWALAPVAVALLVHRLTQRADAEGVLR